MNVMDGMKQAAPESLHIEQSLSPFLTLHELLHPFVDLPKKFDREILGIATDSRRVQPGFVFVAHKGYGKLREILYKMRFSGAVTVSELSCAQDTKTSYWPAQQKNALCRIFKSLI